MKIVFYGILVPSSGRLSHAVHHSTTTITVGIQARDCRKPTSLDTPGRRFPTTPKEQFPVSDPCRAVERSRYQRHLLGLACSQKPLVELLEVRVVAGGDKSTHVQDGPHRSPSSPRLPLAATLAGVAVEGSDPHQGAQSFVRDAFRARATRPGACRASTRPTPETLLSRASLALKASFSSMSLSSRRRCTRSP